MNERKNQFRDAIWEAAKALNDGRLTEAELSDAIRPHMIMLERCVTDETYWGTKLAKVQ
jgi:hypothetical protein